MSGARVGTRVRVCAALWACAAFLASPAIQALEAEHAASWPGLVDFTVGDGFLSGAALAQEDPVFRDYIRAAVRRQPSLGVQLARREEFGASVREAQAGWLPQVSGGLVYRGEIETTNRSAFDRGSRTDLVLSVSQRLWDFGATSADIRAARSRADAQSSESVAVAEQLVLRAVVAHYDVLRYEAQVQIAGFHLDQGRRLLAMVRDRVDAGAGSSADVLRVESRVVDLDSQLIRLAGQRDRAFHAYREIFGFEPGKLRLPATVFGQELEELPDFAELRASHPALQRQRALLEAAASDRQGASARLYPRFSLELQARRFDVLGSSSAADENDLIEGDDDVAVLLQMQYDIFTGGALQSRKSQAMARERQALLEYEQLERDLVRDVRSAYSDAASGREALRATVLAVRADEQTLLAFYDQFTIGRRNLTEVLDTQRDLFLSSLELVNRRVDHDLLRFQQLAVKGRLLDAFDLSGDLLEYTE